MTAQQGIQIRSGLVGQILGVSHPTIKKWVERGLVRIVARTPGGHALFDFAEIEQLRRRLEGHAAAASPLTQPVEPIETD